MTLHWIYFCEDITQQLYIELRTDAIATNPFIPGLAFLDFLFDPPHYAFKNFPLSQPPWICP
jgi:hypothetical protein